MLLEDKQTYKARENIVRPATFDAQLNYTRPGGSATANWLQPKVSTTRDAEGCSKTIVNLKNDQLSAVRPAVKIRFAMDSGACPSVAHPSVMPSGAVITTNTGGKHFSGARMQQIKRIARMEERPERQAWRCPVRLESGYRSQAAAGCEPVCRILQSGPPHQAQPVKRNSAEADSALRMPFPGLAC